MNKIQIFVDYWIKELFDYYYWYEGNKDETDKYLLLIKERKPEIYSTMKNVVDTSRKNYQTDIEKAFDIIEKMDLELTNKLISPHNFKNISLTEEALYEILRHELNK
ncbi:hypothetical protein NPA07_02535 [Mycoplasmopsis caviae]|uniref:Uncharacterized protein n=1 Tax=Mycoplasmopsis caviae TaxID=55603 RepID=A0ABY5J1F5_9BACT|nr:hypothetical protein [Mycoplasmopsis caviae]UUD35729.1 hypothetical protein NPA07_02535 [Mycoplasmopsis caviae]